MEESLHTLNHINMFGLFKKTSELDKLQKKYEKLMADWHRLSTTNRAESDKKYAEAEQILKQIEALKS
ncbi:hypothetical protein SAMN05444148_2702 [Winogradskyella jejuensis]|uniref:Lacal_2735 family protein n=2 Tax=Winogradskyella jejuensis TaxID=1089305 RepID=A0A1M5V371_9FLAO|nr:hypothetical protein SAMN05444148_2702 [Winogradskyella jejuensis]